MVSRFFLQWHKGHSSLTGSCVKTLHLSNQALTHTVILLRAWLTSSLLAADICQLYRKLQYTSLVPAFRCCRLTHPCTIKLTHSWFAQTRAGMAWGKTLLVSSSWLIPSGYAVNRTDIQTSYTELKLCFTSTGTKAVSHPCNYVHYSDPFIFLEDLVSYVTYFSSYPVVGDSCFPSMSWPLNKCLHT